MNAPATSALPATVALHLRGLRHIGLVTPELEAQVDRLRSIFNLVEESIVRVDGPDARFAFLAIGGVPYEIIEPVSDRFRELLLGRDRGINHVCYEVVDLTGAVTAMATAGVRLGHVTPEGIVEMPHARMAYFDPADTGGLLIEFVESRR